VRFPARPCSLDRFRCLIGLLIISDAIRSPARSHLRSLLAYRFPPCEGGALCRRAARLWRPLATPQALEPGGVPRALTIAAVRDGSAGTLRVSCRPLRRAQPRPPGRRLLRTLCPLRDPLLRRAPSVPLRRPAPARPQRPRRRAARARRPPRWRPPLQGLWLATPPLISWPRCAARLSWPHTRPRAFLRPLPTVRACPRWRPSPCPPPPLSGPSRRLAPRPRPTRQTRPTGRRVARQWSLGTPSCPSSPTTTLRRACGPPYSRRRPPAAARAHL